MVQVFSVCVCVLLLFTIAPSTKMETTGGGVGGTHLFLSYVNSAVMKRTCLNIARKKIITVLLPGVSEAAFAASLEQLGTRTKK